MFRIPDLLWSVACPKKSCHIRYDAAGRRAGGAGTLLWEQREQSHRQVQLPGDVDIHRSGYIPASSGDSRPFGCSAGNSWLHGLRFVPSRWPRFEGTAKPWRKPSGRHSYGDRRLGYSYHRGKFRDENIREEIGEKKVRIVEMAVRGGQARQGVVGGRGVLRRKSPAAPGSGLSVREMIEAAIAAGATVINIPDTTGYAVPEQYGPLIAAIKEKVPNIGRAIISVHCHDDLDLRLPIRWRAFGTAARQWKAPSTGSAREPGMRRWKKSSWRCARGADYFKVHTDIEAREFAAPAAWCPTCSHGGSAQQSGRGGNAFRTLGNPRGWIPERAGDL